MSQLVFDSLANFEKLKAAGVPDAQAKVLAETLRAQSEAQASAISNAFREYDAARQKELATKGDVHEIRIDMERIRKGDIQEIRLEIEKVRAEMKTMEIRLLKWQFGIALALAVIMAKGFGWLGF